MSDNKLTKLDFAPGIKASNINKNFDVVHDWIKAERRRVGGAGIIDGFETTVDTENFTVTVSDGNYVSKDGEIHHVEGQTFKAGEPDYISVQEKILCPADGIIQLSSRPYSPSRHAYIRYVVPQYPQVPQDAIFKITCAAENDSRVFFTQIDGTTIYISRPDAWHNKELTINYLTTDNRVDSVLLNQDGTYTYQKSIISDSPSHVDLGDYEKGVMLLSVIEWKIGYQMDAAIYTNHRSFRNVYVNDDAELYLNGHRYRDAQQIYMTEPADPNENDIWYDAQNNCLMIWRKQFGDWGWVLMNDTSTVTIKDKKMWTPENWPSDNKTFLFDSEENNLYFVPGTNSLEVIVDNAPLMSDQFEEIISKSPDAPDYMSNGIGFKLKEEIARPTFVECIVTHQAKTKPTKDTFQRAAVFISEGYSLYASSNEDRIFVTKYPFTVGANQLEVWVSGVRLNPGKDFIEMKDETVDADEIDIRNGVMSKYFRIPSYPLVDGSCVSYKISKYVWNYDQVATLMGTAFEDIKDVKAQCDDFRSDISNMNAHVSKQLDTLAKSIDQVDQKASEDRVAILENGQVKMPHLDTEVRNHLVGKTFSYQSGAIDLKPLSGVKTSDFILVYSVNSSGTAFLVPNIDYTVADTANGLRIDLEPKYIISGNTIYVTGITMGV